MNTSTHENTYTCPMHLGIRLARPGNCPKCGMTLELLVNKTVSSLTEYVCLMHPKIIHDYPGNCPKCGMTLEARVVSDAAEDSQELTAMSRRFWLSAALSLPVFILAMAHDVLPGLMTAKTRGCASRTSILSMVFKLTRSAEQRWLLLRGSDMITRLVAGVQFKNGFITETENHQRVAA